MRTRVTKAAIFVSLAGLFGCGSDDDPVTDITPPPVAEEKHPHPDVFGPIPNHTMKDKVVYLYWGIPKPSSKDKPITIRGEEVIAWLDEKHNGEAIINQHRKIWKPGNFSNFDVIAYAADKLKERICQQWKSSSDCDLNVQYSWNPERMTHDVSVNGETNWNHSYWYWSGNDEDHGVQNLEYFGYIRADELIAMDKTNIGFHPVDDMEQQITAQKTEVARLEQNQGKMIIPLITVQTQWRVDPNVEFHEWYITEGECLGNPNNYCFSPDINLAQLDDNGKPMSHKGKVDDNGNFSSCGITGGKCNDKEFDYNIHNLEVKAHNLRPDIYYDGVITMADVVLSLKDHPSGKHSGTMVYWPILGTDANPESFAFQSIDGLYASGNHGWLFDWGEINNTHFYFNSPHIMPDKVLLTNPERIKWRYADFYASYGEWQKFIAYDDNDPYKYTRHKVNEAQWPLNASHFGWKVADCEQCHTANDMNFECLNADGKTTAEAIEPAKCAECHGNNGAPEGHLEKAMCVRCHIDLVGHGNALKNRLAHPFEKHGIGLMQEFSDPYSCVSCHQNEHDVIVGGK